jgi:AraC family transcriptional regulator
LTDHPSIRARVETSKIILTRRRMKLHIRTRRCSMKALASHAISIAPSGRPTVSPPAGSFATERRPPGRSGEQSDADRLRALPGSAGHAAIDPAVTIFPSQGVIRHRASWRGMAAEAVGVTRHGRVEFRFRAGVHLLVLLEAGARSDGLTLVEGLPGSALRDYKRKLIFVPAGHEFTDWQETRSLPRVAFFYFEPGALAPDGGTSLAPRLFFEDAELWKTALKLKSVVEGRGSPDRRYCEALGTVLAHDLVSLAPDMHGAARQIRGGLAGWQQQLVTKHIEERLAEQVPLAALAGLVRLSPYHFSRSFKQSFGMPPHRFHSHRRIERAKALLADRAMSVTRVGMALGFSSASSFTMSFRKVAGMTPSAWRRSTI